MSLLLFRSRLPSTSDGVGNRLRDMIGDSPSFLSRFKLTESPVAASRQSLLYTRRYLHHQSFHFRFDGLSNHFNHVVRMHFIPWCRVRKEQSDSCDQERRKGRERSESIPQTRHTSSSTILLILFSLFTPFIPLPFSHTGNHHHPQHQLQRIASPGDDLTRLSCFLLSLSLSLSDADFSI